MCEASLEPMYPVIFFDAMRVKVRDDAVVRNKAVHLALGVLADGTRDVLGNWIEQTEGAKVWLKVFNDLKSRGVNDMLIAVVDGLKGLNILANKVRSAKEWKAAMNQFAVMFGDRFTAVTA